MSAVFDPKLPIGQQEPRVFTFAQPATNTSIVLGVDSTTTETNFTLNSNNTIIRVIENQPSGATPQYIYELRRDGFRIRDFYSSLAKDDQQPPWAGFPLMLGPGKYQLAMRQPVTGTGLAGRTLTVMFQTSLV